MSTPAVEPVESGIAPTGASSAAAADSSTNFFADVLLHKPSKFVVDVSSGATSLLKGTFNGVAGLQFLLDLKQLLFCLFTL